jgi:hypothetical protein
MGIMERWGLPDWAGWSIVVAIVIAVEAALAIYTVWRHNERKAQAARVQHAIQRNGMPATARILQSLDTGARLGAEQYFIWKLRLSVQPGAATPFETEISVPLSPMRFGDFSEGRDIQVRMDARTREVVVDQRTE